MKLSIDKERFLVKLGNKVVTLCPKQYDLLFTLADADGRVLSREYLLKKIWRHPEPTSTRTVDQHVAKLRRKLGSRSFIRTVTTKGYAFAG